MLGASLNSYIYPIFFEVQQCIGSIKNWVQIFLNSIFQTSGSLHELQPLFVIGISIAVIFVVVLFIKKVVWGS